jgi:hypothetical protein
MPAMIRNGGETTRQRRASERLRFVRLASRGRWLTSDEASASRATHSADHEVLRLVNRAAQEAVAAALTPSSEKPNKSASRRRPRVQSSCLGRTIDPAPA